MSSVTTNVHGKTKMICSCGVPVNLEPHEIVDWLNRHHAHNPLVEHKLSTIQETSREDAQEKLVNVLDLISKRLQSDQGKK